MFTQALGDTSTGFEAEWRYRADLQGLGTSVGRHPSANLLPIFNGAYREMLEQALQWGYTQLLTRGTTTTPVWAPVEVGEGYAVIATTASMQQIKQVDFRYSSGGDWRSLEEVSITQLRDLALNSTTAPPRGWCLLETGISGADLTGQIAIAPVPPSGSYVLWTMPEFTALTGAAGLFAYHAECWRKWHIYKAMQEVCVVRDKDTQRIRDAIDRMLDPAVEQSPAHQMRAMAPTAAGPKTWTRSPNYWRR